MSAGTKMKIKKGDTVQMLTGKDRGKQGRVVQAHPREGKVIVENLNIARAEPEAEADARHEPHGRPADDPGRDHRPADGGLGRERHARLPDLQAPDAHRHHDQGSEGRDDQGARLQARRLRPGDRSPDGRRRRHERDDERRANGDYVPRLKQLYNDELRAQLQKDLEPVVGDAGAAAHEDHAEHGRRRGEDRREGARRRDRGAHDHRRAARPAAPRPQVDRAVQAPRGHARRRAHDAARRPDVGVLRPARLDRAPAHPRLPRPQPGVVRRPRQLLARPARADHLPRDRLRQRRPDPRPRRRDHDHRRRPTSRPRRCCAAWACRLQPKLEGTEETTWPRSR